MELPQTYIGMSRGKYPDRASTWYALRIVDAKSLYRRAIARFIGFSVVMATIVAFGVAVAMLVVTVIRTMLEDSTLQRELPGYREYWERVRYKLAVSR